MAIRKFIFFNGTEGYSQEQASNDELSLGKVTLSGVSGVALDVGGADIANLGAPTGANSAARKAYVDSGLATEAAARAADVVTVNAAITAEATARANADTSLQGNITAEANARIAADAALQTEIDAEEVARAAAVTTLTTSLSAEQTARIAADAALQAEIDAEETARANAISGVQSALSAEATTRANADTALQAEIDAEETARAAADSTLTTNLAAEQTARIAADTQLATAYAAADTSLSQNITSAYQAADAQVVSQMQAYADSLQAGFSVKAPVKAIATSNITLSGTQAIDGVSLVAGDRVLVAGQTAGQNNGIYLVAAGSWTRSADADSSTEVKDGMSVFVEQGTDYGNSTWVLITNNAITLGTTALEFVRFSGLGQITAGNGLAQSGNELSVNAGNGIELVADAVAAKVQSSYGLSVDGDGVRVDLASGKGLEFSGGDLAIKLESDAGMAFDATNGGLELKLVSPSRLVKSDSGLDVTGVPSQFQINGSLTTPKVTALALNALTSSSGTPLSYFGNGEGDGFHSHTALAFRLTTGNVPAGKAGYITASGELATASCSGASTARAVGVCVSSNGTASSLVSSGQLYLPTSVTITPGTPYYLGSDGSVVEYGALVAGDRVVRLGYGMASGQNPQTFQTVPRMHVSIQDLGQKA